MTNQPSIQELYAAYEEAEARRHAQQGAIEGGSFVLDQPEILPLRWGTQAQPLAVEGEGMLIVGPQGVGKSTVAQQYVNARAGCGASEVLGLPVEPLKDGTLLYLALDRPRQIARSWKRMISEEHRERLDAVVHVWQGPLPFSLGKEPPEKLLGWARNLYQADIREIVIDSYKDLGGDLSKEEIGHAINHTAQWCLAEGVQWTGLHHQRKATGENRRPSTLADVYGSTWLTSGMGSVFILWGEAGSATVEGFHIKQPADPVGPFVIFHDHASGTSTVAGSATLEATGAKRTRHLKILGAFRNGDRLTLEDLLPVAGVSDKTLREDLKALVEGGHLAQNGEAGLAATWALRSGAEA